MSEWQPLSTAPKDGKVYLGFDADDGGGLYCGVVAIHWRNAHEDIPEEYPAEWCVSEIGSGDKLRGCNLTHWQPLPEPPK